MSFRAKVKLPWRKPVLHKLALTDGQRLAILEHAGNPDKERASAQ